MADEITKEVASPDDAAVLAKTLTDITDSVATLSKSITEMDAKIAEKAKVAPAPWMTGAPALAFGERPERRKFSYSRLALGLQKQKQNDDSWRDTSKLEMEFCRTFSKGLNVATGHVAVPIGAEFLSEEFGLTHLRKEWDDMAGNLADFDPDEMRWLQGQLSKEMSFRTHNTGGTFVDFPEQGEMIDLLRASSVFGQIPGISNVQLPQQGSIRYPRVTSGVTISSYAEVETVSGSTPGTDEVSLEAKKYAGVVKLSEEFMKFATSVSADAFIRSEMTQDINLQVDSDIIVGGGGKSIHGLTNYTGITTHAASTPGAIGDTLEPADIDILLAKMADANAPVDRGVFVVLRNRLWASLRHREDTVGRPKFQASAMAYGGGRVQKQMSGEPVYTSTNIPNTRVKSTATDLTMVLAGVASELYLGRAGAMEIAMTNSDASDFTQGRFTLRGVHYVDAAPKHEVSFGLIDQLLQS